ncbi:2-succinyl-5-enolpyruvyl-6-hydroxy-3-cyclohexene-1-carboxylic-acid synthase [Nocardioides zeae]|uniref:2-succinyl-5-enolpyruvyl-6-hydroxy-3-cyclohexene-1-carboxylate synthase n=1 Tax=Nocardioides imazamoxiresistens TaxID=3231893 RepID=A0ABU3Q1D2_9ACTN|nr:2-succinyl-5-enolpyruvyl-6-hydroxy-3-cyclohexene-1-carboxylic-acid synthase [Nocardioides zeae]MDT9594825.1 2-succinyl-5-enolpyruvyl-6-hydroxy-3-cyclohexene-1-carboxylic-acid synthase [Nocardioides zeae]
MTDPASVVLSRAVVDALVAAGVREVVLAPGSRNAPLAFAAYASAAAGGLRLHTRIDERSAAFLALGLTRGGSRAAVVCTSGTAVANLHPAVLEAAHSAVGLVVVSADRPASLRGTGASQTTDQVRMFGDAAAFADVADATDLAAAAPLLDGDGPVHLNVQLTPPLVPAVSGRGTSDSRELPEAPRPGGTGRGMLGRRYRDAVERGEAYALPRGPRTVVVAGDDAGPPARILAETAGWPLLAEPSSGARTGPHALRCYRLLLDGPLGAQVERVVVAGHPTLSRPVTRLLERADVEVVSWRHAGRWADRPFPVASEHDAVTVEAAGAGPGEPDGWLAAWTDADREAARRVDRALAIEPDLTPYEVAGAVARALPPGGLLVVGASSPIRDLDLMATPQPAGQRRFVLANRGLAGIDGTVSTALGAALARPRSTRSIALLGDVTFLHDAGGLVLGPREERPDLTLVVVNDDGGSIFAMLEQGAPAYADAFDTLFGTPHGVDLAALCAATRTPHWRVESLPELEHALASPAGGIEVVEVRVRRDNRRELDERLRAVVADVPAAGPQAE